MKTNTKTAVAYARFSSGSQRDESIDAQLRAIYEYAKINNIKIINNYIDKAQTGRTTDRKEFQHMVDDVKRKKFDIILVHKLDRFCRNKYESITYKKLFKDNGVNIISITEKIEDTPEGLMLEGLLETINEFYSLNLAREAMKGLKENAYKCLHTGGTPPLGYDVGKDKRLILNEVEAETVKTIFTMFAEGDTLKKIVAHLNLNGCKTKRDAPFTVNSLNSILNNEKYSGVYIYNKAMARNADGSKSSRRHKDSEDIIKIAGGCPKIVPDDIFQKARLKLEHNRLQYKNTYANKYILTGKIRCLECGSPFAGHSKRRSKTDKKNYLYYGCSKTNNYNCSAKLIRLDTFEDIIYTTYIHHMSSQKFKKELKSNIFSQVEAFNDNKTKLHQKLEDIKTQINQVLDLLLKYNKPYLIEKLDLLEEEKANTENIIYKSSYFNINETKAMIENQLNAAKKLERDKVFDLIKHISIFENTATIEFYVYDEYTFKINLKIKGD